MWFKLNSYMIKILTIKFSVFVTTTYFFSSWRQARQEKHNIKANNHQIDQRVSKKNISRTLLG